MLDRIGDFFYETSFVVIAIILGALLFSSILFFHSPMLEKALSICGLIYITPAISVIMTEMKDNFRMARDRWPN